MTPDEKRERRQARHALQNAIRKSLSRTFRMNTTVRQQEQAAKVLADRAFAGHVRVNIREEDEG